MPRITVQTVSDESGARRWALSDRIAAARLDSDFYVQQLIEGLSRGAEEAAAPQPGGPEVDDGRP